MRSDMPHRIYRGSEPPRWWDPLLAHPWELTTAAYGVIGGIIGLAAIADGREISQSLANLPLPFALVALAMLTAGGVLVWAGLLDTSPDLMRGWTLERLGLVLTTGAWALYALAILASFPGSLLSWGIGVTFALASGTRLAATYREEWMTRRADS